MRILTLHMQQEYSVLIEHLNQSAIYADECLDEEDAISLLSFEGYEFEACLYHTNNASQFAKTVRSEGVHTPLICFTGIHDPKMTVMQLNQGADQVVRCPVDKYEAEAVILSTIRRCKGVPDPVMEFGGITINLATKNAYVGEKRVHITKMQWLILETLALAGCTLSCDRIVEQIYTADQYRESKIIDVFICRLNQEFQKHGLPYKPIKTVWGVGRYLSKGDE